MYAGNIGFAQNLEFIIEALCEANIGNLQLTLVGRGRNKSRLISLTKRLRIEQQVEFLDYIPPSELVYLYEKTDALLLPLKSNEVFDVTIPGKFQSYLAQAKPILGIISGVTARLINEHKIGVTAHPDNKSDIMSALQKVVSLSVVQRSQMERNALELASTMFDRMLY